MCYSLFKRITATCLVVSEGRMVSLPQRYGTTVGRRKSLSPGERPHTHGSSVHVQTVGAKCRDQKSVGTEPRGKICLLTFTLIGPSEAPPNAVRLKPCVLQFPMC